MYEMQEAGICPCSVADISDGDFQLRAQLELAMGTHRCSTSAVEPAYKPVCRQPPLMIEGL